MYDEGDERTSFLRMVLYFVVFVFLFLGIFILIGYILSNRKSGAKSKNKPVSWMDLPEESKLFSFTETSKTELDFYFEGNEISVLGKIIIFILLIALLVYLFYPMLSVPRLGTVFFIISACIVLRLFYLLINKNKSIIDDKN
jgi:hypothetical protein